MSQTLLEKTFNPQAIEQSWYKYWENSGYFKPANQGESYCIMIPPPNVTGSLHMGHGFQCTLMDALIRYHRMRGFNTLWQVGTDHAGIATQMIVERQLAAEGKSRYDLGREKFIEAAHEWKNTSGSRITQQLRRLGASVDWDRERFTMDPALSAAVQRVFIELYEQGLIYRGKRLVNWDPKFKTAISDLEVLHEDREGQLYHLRYPLAEQDGYIVVATSRPETLFGDVAVAVNPHDERYQHLVGKQVKLPLTDRLIPIIADEYALAEFGSGCVKVTPAHDFRDHLVGQRRNLPMINIINPDATLNENVPAPYQGLDRFVAREHVMRDLQQLDLVDRIEAYQTSIPIGDRSGVMIEPYLTDQWFVKIAPLADKALDVVEKGDIRFVPENWVNTYYQWMRNIEDWCISRQLWWGHRIPAWYDEHGKIYVGHDEHDIRKKYQLNDHIQLAQDHDVLDTWFSSALWPFSTLGWPQYTDDFKQFYPTQVLVTGFDIIFFWVARMIMMGLHFTQQIPFRDVYITGLIRDHDGQKMSKSKGNIIDPLDLIDGIDLESLVAKRTQHLMQPAMAARIEKATRKQFPDGIPAYGTDALRFTFCALASTGRDIRFDTGRIEGYRNFCNKLWNASRYVLMNVSEPVTSIAFSQLNVIDQWIIGRLQQLIQHTHDYFANYRFDLLAQALYEFIWNEFCDWYLELSKPLLNHADQHIQHSTRYTLVVVLETILRLIHPIMPFISEEIWQRVASLLSLTTTDTIMTQMYPIADETLIQQTIIDDVEWLKQVIVSIRTIRAEKNISPARSIHVLFVSPESFITQRISDHSFLIQSLAKISKLEIVDEQNIPALCAFGFVNELKIYVPLAELLDIDVELQRLQKDMQKLRNEEQRAQTKLANPDYVKKAPAAVVEKEQIKLAELQQVITQLQLQLDQLMMIKDKQHVDHTLKTTE